MSQVIFESALINFSIWISLLTLTTFLIFGIITNILINFKIIQTFQLSHAIINKSNILSINSRFQSFSNKNHIIYLQWRVLVKTLLNLELGESQVSLYLLTYNIFAWKLIFIFATILFIFLLIIFVEACLWNLYKFNISCKCWFLFIIWLDSLFENGIIF